MNYEQINPRAVSRCLDTMGRDSLANGSDKVTESPTRGVPLLAQSLAANELLAISDGVATTIRIDLGEVLITEDGSFIDHILCAGQQYTLDRTGRATVAARAETLITLYAPRMGVPPRIVERFDRGRATNDVLYARSLLLNAVARLMSLWARRPAVPREPSF